MMSIVNPEANEAFNLIVGGFYYSLQRRDIDAHPDCYFASAMKNVWNSSGQPIVINRDGILFQHIFGSLYNCRYKPPFVANDSLELMIGVRREADYYNFPELVALYDNACKEALRNWCKAQSLSSALKPCAMYLQTEIASTLEELVNVEIYPSCQVGLLDAPHWAPSIAENDKLGRLFIKTRESPKYRNFQLSHSMAHQGLLNYLQENLPTLPGNPCYFTNPQLLGVVNKGKLYVPSVGAVCTNRIGTVMYILRSTYTGGTITATRNGVCKSIANPGEYIMYTSEYTCESSKITSGALVYVSYDIVRHVESVHSNAGLRKTTLVPHSALPGQSTLLQAVHCELGGPSCGDIQNDIDKVAVVLCLSTLYPIFEFDPSGPYLETDPDALTDRDAVLYEYLNDDFEVTLVTVLVQRHGKDCKGCVLRPAPTTDCRIKIITPYHNYTEPFEVSSSLVDSEKWYATLYTAMYTTAK